MRKYYFDLRSGDLKVLVKEGESIVYTLFIENVNDIEESVKNALKSIKESTGYDPGSVNLILPDEEFIVKEMLLPKISDEETVKLIKKRLESDLKTKEFSFCHNFLKEEENGRLFLIQVIKAERLQYYHRLFKSYKIGIEKITSGLILNIKIAEEVSLKDNKPKIIVEIERNAIDIFAVVDGNILKYQHFNLPKVDLNEFKDNEISYERLIKKQIYLITDYIYNFNLSATQEFVDLVPDSFIIYGAALKIYEGTITALKEALPQNIDLLAERVKMKSDDSIFISLYYFSALGEERIFNFVIKIDYREVFSNFVKSKKVVVLLILIFAGLLCILEYLNFSYKRSLANKKAELERNIKILKTLEGKKEIDNRIRESRVQIYYILKELANKLPEDVYLERLVLMRNEVNNKNILELTYNISLDKGFSKKKILTSVKETFNNVSWVKVTGEPGVSSKIWDKKDFLVIKINYELDSYAQ